jgi:transposase InsO family protein
MRLDNLLALRRSAFVATTDSDHELLVHLNLARRMQLSGINQLWVADITFVRLQHASAEYGSVLDKYQIIASMSRLANPWDNAKCESFMKTLKREEIHANEYRGLEDLRKNVATFVDVYYNTQRLHSALGYNTPEHFEATLSCAIAGENREMSFRRHPEIFQSDASREVKPPEGGLPNHRLDESPAGYSLSGWSPPEPDSASPASLILKCGKISRKKK